MDRIIKFRARNANVPRCWIYGYFVKENGICFIVNNEGKFKVISGTESQYTGLTDRNGNEIFEGDKIEHSQYPTPLVVQWDYDQWGLFDGICNEASIDEHCEVIGNIYEGVLPKLESK